jgi:hypothetical protein
METILHLGGEKPFGYALEHYGEIIFETLVKHIADEVFDAAAAHGVPGDVAIGVIRSADCATGADEFGKFIITLDVAQMTALMTSTSNLEPRGHQVARIHLTVRGQGLSTHGNFLQFHKDCEHTAEEAAVIEQLPYMSLAKARAFLDRNTGKLTMSRKSIVNLKFHLLQANTDTSTGVIKVSGNAVVKLYLMGSGYAQLTHDLTFELMPIASRL